MITVFERNMLSVPNGHLTTIESALFDLTPDVDFRFLISGDEVVNTLPKHSKYWPILSTMKEIKRNRKKAYHRDYSNLVQYLNEFQSPEGSALLLPSAGYLDVRFVLEYLKQFEKHVRFYLRVLMPSVIGGLTASEVEELQDYITSGSIVLLTETKTLAEVFMKDYNLPDVVTLLLPCTFSPSKLAMATNSEYLNPKVFRIGHMGSIRKDKGFEFAPKILANLSKGLTEQKRSFKIEYKMGTKWRKIYKLWIVRMELGLFLGSLKFKFRKLGISIKRLPNMSDNAKFASLFNEIDIVVLPYDLERYASSGSGIVIDAVMKGKPIVYADGIGMAEHLNYGNAKSAKGVKDFANAILVIMDNFEEYCKCAKYAQSIMQKQFDNSTQFLKQIDYP